MAREERNEGISENVIYSLSRRSEYAIFLQSVNVQCGPGITNLSLFIGLIGAETRMITGHDPDEEEGCGHKEGG